jgi:transcriptional regulator of met regulon
MLKTHSQVARKSQLALIGIVLNLSIVLLCMGLPSKIASAEAISRSWEVKRELAGTDFRPTQNSCPTSQPTKPGLGSLLIVLLDRSGSLIDEPGATDPKDYSTSVTRVLADHWPGRMVVIPFKGDRIPLQQIGPNVMSDPTQRDNLKNQIPEPDPHGDTPLGPALDQALQLLQVASPGSKVVIITDGEPNTTGDPDGSLQAAHIRNDLLKQFCHLGIPISPFGLEIHDPRADALLSDIATGTGGTYTKVQSSEQLAQSVVHMYRDWQNLALSQPARDVDGSYSVFINDFATYAYIVVFRSNSSFHVYLYGSDGKTPVSGLLPLSIDRHYVIYKLGRSSFSTNIFRVKVVSDKGVLDSAAQVYALADHPLLNVRLISQSPLHAFTQQPLAITAALFKGSNLDVPKSAAMLTADLTFYVNGKPVQTVTGTLIQQAQDVFSLQFPAYSEPGQVRIVVHATYEGIQVDSQTYTLQLAKPPYVCTRGEVQCIWEQNRLLILGTVVPLLALLLLLIGLIIWCMRWRDQPAPYGWLVDERNMHAVELGNLRPFFSKVLHKSVIDVGEIENNPDAFGVFDFAGEPCQFVFKPTGVFFRRNGKGFSGITVRIGTKEVTLDERTPEVELHEGSSIKVSHTVVGTFQTTTPLSQRDLSFVYT